MKTPVGVILTAILAICGSLLFLGMAVLEGVMLIIRPGGAQFPQGAGFALGFGLALFAAVGAWGLTTAIGLFRLRNWARISTIIFSVLLALMSLTTVPILFLMPAPPNAPPEFPTILHWMAAAYALLGLIGVLLTWYFLRAGTKAAFGGAVAADSGRPLSLSIIGWGMLISGVVCMPAALLRMPVLVLGLFLTGWLAGIAMLVLGALYVYAGRGILKLDPQARWLAIGLLLFACLNSVLMAVMPGATERIMEASKAMPFVPPNAPMAPLPSWFMLLGIPVMLIPLWFLVTRKSAFSTGAAA